VRFCKGGCALYTVQQFLNSLSSSFVTEFFHLGNKKLYPAEWRQAFNRKISEGRRVLDETADDFVLE
jgi:hypothetical protein